jgi:hypothetical protein
MKTGCTDVATSGAGAFEDTVRTDPQALSAPTASNVNGQ